jgi:hypothetical protein
MMVVPLGIDDPPTAVCTIGRLPHTINTAHRKQILDVVL